MAEEASKKAAEEEAARIVAEEKALAAAKKVAEIERALIQLKKRLSLGKRSFLMCFIL